MTPAGCRAALAALIETVPGIGAGAGIIHQRRRILRTEQDIKTLLVGSAPASAGLVNAWMVSPAATATSVTTRHPGFKGIGVKGGGQALTVMQWQVEAYYQINDGAASETTFHDLVWTVVNELNQYGGLSIPGLVEQLPADIEQFGYIMLAGLALYHYAKVQIAFHGRTVLG